MRPGRRDPGSAAAQNNATPSSRACDGERPARGATDRTSTHLAQPGRSANGENTDPPPRGARILPGTACDTERRWTAKGTRAVSTSVHRLLLKSRSRQGRARSGDTSTSVHHSSSAVRTLRTRRRRVRHVRTTRQRQTRLRRRTRPRPRRLQCRGHAACVSCGLIPESGSPSSGRLPGQAGRRRTERTQAYSWKAEPVQDGLVEHSGTPRDGFERSSKPVRSRNPRLGRFDSCAAPFLDTDRLFSDELHPSFIPIDPLGSDRPGLPWSHDRGVRPDHPLVEDPAFRSSQQ